MPREPLIQWKYRRSPWKLLVACICLNRTQGMVAKPIIEEIFRRWPTPASLSGADRDELRSVIRPLGLQTNRSRHLMELSRRYNPTRMPREVVEELPGCGPYAADCYQMLVLGDLTVEPEDKELRRWREWALQNPPRWVTRRPSRRFVTGGTDPWQIITNGVDVSDFVRRFSGEVAAVGDAARKAARPLAEWQRSFTVDFFQDFTDQRRRIRLEGGPLDGEVRDVPDDRDRWVFPHVEHHDVTLSTDYSRRFLPEYRALYYQRSGRVEGRVGEPMTEIFTLA